VLRQQQKVGRDGQDVWILLGQDVGKLAEVCCSAIETWDVADKIVYFSNFGRPCSYVELTSLRADVYTYNEESSSEVMNWAIYQWRDDDSEDDLCPVVVETKDEL
jgi:hypothetical protein